MVAALLTNHSCDTHHSVQAALMPHSEDSMIAARSARQQGLARAIVLLTVDVPFSFGDKVSRLGYEGPLHTVLGLRARGL